MKNQKSTLPAGRQEVKSQNTEKVCVYCRKNPGADKQNKILWFGFLDKDTDQLVCMNCRKKHYREKSKTEFKGLYTEFPVYAE